MEDAASAGWTTRAACRWITYSLIWTLSTGSGALSAYHPVMQIIAAVLGCLLAISLPLLFATLFEITYARGARSDLPVMCFPWMGSVIVGFGMLFLLESSSFLVALFSSAKVDSAQTLTSRYAGKSRHELPHTVCIGSAFVRTDWEAGKLRCEYVNGHLECSKAYVAAPIFNSKSLADAGKAEEIYAWAVTTGRHVDVTYRRDGELCGYLNGMDMDYHESEFKLAVARLIQKHRLSLGRFVEGLGGATDVVPLEARPLLLTADPLEVTHFDQAFFALAVVLLCCCPCAGPLPIGALLLFACWAKRGSQGSHHVVAHNDDDYGDDEEIEGDPYVNMGKQNRRSLFSG